MDKRWLKMGVVVGVILSLTACGAPNWHEEAQLQVCQHASDTKQCKERVRSGNMDKQDVPGAGVVLTDEELFKRAENARKKSDDN